MSTSLLTGFLQTEILYFIYNLSTLTSSRTPVPEKLPVIEASQSSLNQSSESGEDSGDKENPPPSYHDIILQDTQMDGDALKYENCFCRNLFQKVNRQSCTLIFGEEGITRISCG